MIEVYTVPAEEPVSLTEAKAHCRVVSSDDDTYITALIKAARQTAEAYLKRAICTQTIEYSMDSFPAEIELPRAPIQSVSSITYTDTNGATQTLSGSAYQSNLRGTTGNTIKPAYGYSWPSVRDGVYNAVIVRYVAGYGVPSSSPNPIPVDIKHAILLMIGEMYENREQTVIGASVSGLPLTAERLLSPHRIGLI